VLTQPNGVIVLLFPTTLATGELPPETTDVVGAADVGAEVGLAEADLLGAFVGSDVGTEVGLTEGDLLGSCVGSLLGTLVGSGVGTEVGLTEGDLLGSCVGSDVGGGVGLFDGCI